MESIVPQKLHVFFSDEVFPGGGGVFEKMARGGNLSAGEEKRFERCVVWLMNNDPDFEDYCHELDLEGVLQVAPNLMIKE